MQHDATTQIIWRHKNTRWAGHAKTAWLRHSICAFTALFAFVVGFADCNALGDEAADTSILETFTLSELETLAKVSEWIEKAHKWQAAAKTIRADLKALQAAEDAGKAEEQVQSLVKLVTDIDQELNTIPPKIRQYLATLQKVVDAYTKAAAAADAAAKTYNAQIEFDIDETKYRDETKRLILAIAADQLLNYVDSGLVDELTGLSKPADYAKKFLTNEFLEWCKTGYEAGDFKIWIVPEKDKPLFSKQQPLTIKMEYCDGQVDATGVYLEYVPGQDLPNVNTEHIKVDVTQSVKDTVMNYVQGAAMSAISEVMPTGLKIKHVDWSGMTNGGPMTFDVSFDFGSGSMGASPSSGVRAQGTGFRLYARTKNPLDIEHVKITIQLTTTTTPTLTVWVIGFWGFFVSITPFDGTLQGGTAISSTVTPPESIAFFVSVETKPPFAVWKFNGDLRLLNTGYNTDGPDAKTGFTLCLFPKPKGDTEESYKEGNVIDFSKGHMTGKGIVGPQEPLASILHGEANLDAKSEYVRLTGHLDICRQRCSNVQLDIRFKEQVATISVIDHIMLLGANFASNLDGRIDAHKGLDRPKCKITAIQSLLVSGAGFLPDLNANVSISIDSEKRPNIVHVEATAFGGGTEVKIEEDLPDLTALKDKKWLRDRLLTAATKTPNIIERHLAAADKQFREFGRNLDSARVDFINKHKKIDTGNEDLNRFQDELIKNADKGGSALTKAREKWGKLATEKREQLQDLLPSPPSPDPSKW